MPKILIVAGEVSGDMHAGRIVSAMRRRRPDLEFHGIGGPVMRAAGVATWQDIGPMAVLGFVEVLRHLGFFARVMRETVAWARGNRPDLAILIDYPGFNLRLAKRLHAMGIRVAYYVCPQVWAWHRERIPEMAGIIDRLVTIFPFEADLFRGTKLPVTFAGHPLVDAAAEARRAPPEDLGWKGTPRVALLPGSRAQEVNRILPVMWRAAEELERRTPGATFVVAAPGPQIADVVANVARRTGGGPARWKVIAGKTREVLRQADGGMVASGTATIEAALMGCPMIVVYRTAPLTYVLGRILVRISHLGMVNIVAGRTICPEFIQGKAVPAHMADALIPMMQPALERSKVLAGLGEVAARLGAPGAIERAADALLGEIPAS